MKKMIAIMTTLLLSFVVTTAFAWPSHGGYGAHGKGMMNDYSYLSDETKEKVQAIKNEYKPRLERIHDKMVEKWNEMRTARSNEQTTVGQLRTLKIDMFDLKQSYQKTRFMMTMELRQVTGMKGHGYSYSNYHKHHGYHGYTCGGNKGTKSTVQTDEIES